MATRFDRFCSKLTGESPAEHSVLPLDGICHERWHIPSHSPSTPGPVPTLLSCGAPMECIGHLYVTVVEGKKLAVKAPARPLVVLQLGDKQCVCTHALVDLKECKWQSEFRLNVFSEDEQLAVLLVDEAKEDLIGESTILVRDINPAGTSVVWTTMIDPSGKEAGEICLVLRFLQGALSHGMNGAVSKSMVPKTPSQRNGSHHHQTPERSSSRRRSSEKSVDSRNFVEDDEPEEDAGKPPRSRRGWYLLAAGAAIALLVGAFSVNHQRNKRRYHEVQPGETLCLIADRYGLKPDDVFEANMDVTTDPDKLRPGDKIYIP